MQKQREVYEKEASRQIIQKKSHEEKKRLLKQLNERTRSENGSSKNLKFKHKSAWGVDQRPKNAQSVLRKYIENAELRSKRRKEREKQMDQGKHRIGLGYLTLKKKAKRRENCEDGKTEWKHSSEISEFIKQQKKLRKRREEKEQQQEEFKEKRRISELKKLQNMKKVSKKRLKTSCKQSIEDKEIILNSHRSSDVKSPILDVNDHTPKPDSSSDLQVLDNSRRKQDIRDKMHSLELRLQKIKDPRVKAATRIQAWVRGCFARQSPHPILDMNSEEAASPNEFNQNSQELRRRLSEEHKDLLAAREKQREVETVLKAQMKWRVKQRENLLHLKAKDLKELQIIALKVGADSNLIAMFQQIIDKRYAQLECIFEENIDTIKTALSESIDSNNEVSIIQTFERQSAVASQMIQEQIKGQEMVREVLLTSKEEDLSGSFVEQIRAIQQEKSEDSVRFVKENERFNSEQSEELGDLLRNNVNFRADESDFALPPEENRKFDSEESGFAQFAEKYRKSDTKESDFTQPPQENGKLHTDDSEDFVHFIKNDFLKPIESDQPVQHEEYEDSISSQRNIKELQLDDSDHSFDVSDKTEIDQVENFEDSCDFLKINEKIIDSLEIQSDQFENNSFFSLSLIDECIETLERILLNEQVALGICECLADPNTIMKAIELVLYDLISDDLHSHFSREDSSQCDFMPIKTDSVSVLEYLEDLLIFVLQDMRSLRLNLSTPTYREPLEMLRYLQDRSLNRPYFVSQDSVINKQIFLTLQTRRNRQIRADFSGEVAEVAQTADIIHSQMLFDAINESLQSLRKYGTNGLPYPWSWVDRKNSVKVDIASVLCKVRSQISEWSSLQAGKFPTVDMIQSDGEIDQELVYGIREEKLANILALEVIDYDHLWTNYQFEEDQTTLDLANAVLQDLAFETLLMLNG